MTKRLYVKVFIITITAVIAILLLFPKSETPYSGTYYSNSIDEELNLKSNNTFDIYKDNDKYSISINGKYRISNNHIQLMANDKNNMFFIKDISTGYVTGSIISFKQAKNKSPIIFTKSEWHNMRSSKANACLELVNINKQ